MTASDTPAARVDHLAMLRALGSRSTRAIAASGAVAAYLCSATAATESTESTSSRTVRTDESNPIPGANRREVTPLDAPIAAAYPTAANKATAQWRVYTDIARDLSGRGEHEEAGKYLRRALKEAVAGFGKDDPHVAAALNNLAELYRLQRRWDEAERLYTDAARALEKHYGPGHPAAATATHNLGGCKLARGDHAGAYKTYAAAAEKKAASLGVQHPDYAQTLFHMAEAKRAGGDHEACAVLLERSVRVLDECGQSDSAQSLRRMERLAQVRGELLGDHVTAERLRSKVLEARIRISRAHGDHTQGKRGTVRDLASSQRRAAVAAAHEARAKSLESAGRRTDAIGDLRAAVHIHEARVSDAMGLGIPRELLDADDIRPSGVVRGFIELIEQALNPIFGWARPGAAAEAAAANMRLQLASCRLKLADVLAGAEEGTEDGTEEGGREEARTQLRRAVASLQPLAMDAAAALSKPIGTDGDGPSTGDDGDRSVGAEIRRREASEAPERHVASLVLFARAARALAATESVNDESVRESSADDDAADSYRHLGDAIEWLYAAYGADVLAEGQTRSLQRELRECVGSASDVGRRGRVPTL